MFFMSSIFYAQEKQVSGTVVDSDANIPLPGVEIQVEGTNKGTTTNFDGEFILDGLSPGDVLLLTYVGFKKQRVEIDERNTYNLTLESDVEQLEETIVIGYGKQSRRNVTGAVSKVGSEDIKKLEPLNAAQSLQGTVSGVNVTPQGGSPGAEANIRIRGISTNGNNRPLIILDGIQYEGGLNSINPQDRY